MPTYVLSHNPTTITNQVTVTGTAVYGGSAQAWSVTNLSTISGTSAGTVLGVGIRLAGGGSVANGATNATGAMISGDYYGVSIGDALGTVSNFGTIEGGVGVVLDAGGTVTNGAANAGKASILGTGIGYGGAGVYIGRQAGAGTVTNFGTIASAFRHEYGDGIVLAHGGTVTNRAGALIFGDEGGLGVVVGGASGAVANYGTITSGGAIDFSTVDNPGTIKSFISAEYGGGVRLLDGGTIINGTSGDAAKAVIRGGRYGIYIGSGTGQITNFGSISGGIGIDLSGSSGSTLTNGGTIAGLDGTAVRFDGGDDRLIVEPGAIFSGTVDGSLGADSAEFAHFGTDDVSKFIGFETIELANGGANTLALVDGNFAGVTGAAITVIGGNAGNTVDASALTGANRVVAVGGVETYTLANGAANTLTLVDTNFTGVTGASITVYGGTAGNTVDASALTGGNRAVMVGGVGADMFTGGAGNDAFRFTTAALAASDIVKGGAGTDHLNMTTAGTVLAGGVSGVEVYELANGAANTLSLVNGNFIGVTGASITVYGGTTGNTVNALGLGAPNRAVTVGGAGTDMFTGGAGNDIFEFTVATLAASDTVAGGAGADTLVMTTAGTVAAGGVSGVETYTLANGGANSLTITNSNFTSVTGSVIRVNGGNAGNTVNASGLTGGNRVVLVGGVSSDIFKFSTAALQPTDIVTGGAGADTLVMTTAGAVAVGGVGGVETYTLANGAANSLILVDANFIGVTGASIWVTGGNAGNTVNASKALTGANRVVMVGGAGKDAFTGGAGNDVFRFAAAALAADTVAGGAGSDQLVMTTAGTVLAGGVSAVETYTLANGGANILSLANANFTGVTGASIWVTDGNVGNTVNASALTAPNRAVMVGGAGTDMFTGGAGNDIFRFTAAALAASDTVAGVAGADTLVMTTAGTVAAGGVSGVETYTLANGGVDSLTLGNGNFTGVIGSVIRVNGGNGGNTINASTLPAADHIVVHAGTGADALKGGLGNDVFFAAGKTAMTGGAGADEFAFSAPGSNTIADFSSAAGDQIAFGNAGFALGLSGATATPKPLPAALFTKNATGAFTATTQRFAYDTANGNLFYSAAGTTATEKLVVTLTGHPDPTGHLFFIS